ncbi:MAG: metallophosphoesterase [Oscillospiraceae bacterium]|nr:metallophosphoesterase [Oscillospiraceae bacterium]
MTGKKAGLLLGSAVAAATYFYYENQKLSLAEYTLTFPHLPSAFDGFRILHLSDLHNSILPGTRDGGWELFAEIAPDMIAITGDLVDKRRTRSERMGDALKTATAAVNTAPVFYSSGNHEHQGGLYRPLCREMEKLGVMITDGKKLPFRIGEQTIGVCGLADRAAYRAKGGFTGWMQDLYRVLEEDPEEWKLLLTHSPEHFALYCDAGADLILTGHAHGGQARLPLIGGLYAPAQGPLPLFDGGVYREGDRRMVVSRGVGNSSFPVRFFNPSEISLITLKTEAE